MFRLSEGKQGSVWKWKLDCARAVWWFAAMHLCFWASLGAADLDLPLLGAWPGFDRSAALDIAITRHHAVLVEQSGALAVYDLSNPANPQEMGRYPANALTAQVAGDYAYLSGSALEIVDLSDLLHPRRAGLAPVASKDLKVVGNRAYLFSSRYEPVAPNMGVERGRVEIVDVSHPTSPRVLGHYDTQGMINALDVAENCVYLAEASYWENGRDTQVDGTLHIVDVSDPASPKRIGRELDIRPPSNVVIVGAVAFVAEAPVWDGLATTGGAVRTLDISNPRDPRLVPGDLTSLEWSGYSVRLNTSQDRLCILGTTFRGSETVWRLQSFDVSHPLNPRPGAVHSGKGEVWSAEIDGDYVFMLASPGYLVTLGLRQPQLFRNAIVGSAVDLAERGDHIYLADREAGLEILDVSNPAAVRRVGKLPSKGTTDGVAIDGRTLYVADNWQTESGSRSELAVFDLASPADPQRIGMFEAQFPINHIFVRNQHAYVGGPRRLEIVDVSDRGHPKLAGSTTTIGTGKFAVSGNYAYIVPLGGYGYLQLIDLSNSSKPEAAAQIRMESLYTSAIGATPAYAYVATGGSLEVFDTSATPNLRRAGGQFVRGFAGTAFAVSGRYALLGTHLFDLSRPEEPQAVAAFQGYSTSGSFSHDRLHTASGSRGLEIRDVRPANPQRVGTYESSGVGMAGRVLSGAVSQSHALVATWNSGAQVLEVLDLSNPAQPRNAGRYVPVLPYIQEMLISGDYAWLIGYDASQGCCLEIIRMRRPAAPERIGCYRFNEWISSCGIADGRAYLVTAPLEPFTGNSQLLILDVTNPANPQQIGRCDLTGAAWHVAAVGSFVYAVGPGMGLAVLDVGDPTHPRLVGQYSGYFPYRIEISQTKAILIDGKPGLVVLDVSTPSRPVQVGRYDTQWGALRIATEGDFVYVVGASDSGTGLEVIDIQNPADPKRVGGNSSLHGFDVALAGGHVLVAGDERVWVLDQFRAALWLTAWPAAGTNLLTLRIDLLDDRTYQLQRSTDLQNWEDWKVVSRTGALLRITDVPAHASRFYRLRPIAPTTN